MKNLIYVFALVFISFINAYPQNSEWIVYNTPNSGLPENKVQALAIDGSGNKWIATYLGLAKTNWTVYDTSNSGNRILTLHLLQLIQMEINVLQPEKVS